MTEEEMMEMNMGEILRDESKRSRSLEIIDDLKEAERDGKTLAEAIREIEKKYISKSQDCRGLATPVIFCADHLTVKFLCATRVRKSAVDRAGQSVI